MRKEEHHYKHNQELLLQSRRQENDTRNALSKVNYVMQTENNQRLNDLRRMKAKLSKKKEIEKQRNERIERQL